MINQLYINAKDAYVTWGATLQMGSLAPLFQRGVQKDFTENTSRSIDGKIVSPKNPRQEARTFTIDISIKGSSFEDFLLKQEGLFTELASDMVELSVLGKTFKLIYKKNQMHIADYDHTFGTFKVTFEEPNPADR